MKMLQKMKTKAKPFYSKKDPGHNWEHIERIMKICKKIGKTEKADMNLVLTASVFHGMKKKPKNIKKVLRYVGFDKKEIRKILNTVMNASKKPRTIEEKILHDANRLDGLGAIGLARGYTRGGYINQDIRLATKIIKKFSKRNVLTKYGKRLALERKKIMVKFFKQIRKEL